MEARSDSRIQTTDRIFIRHHVGMSGMESLECLYLNGTLCYTSPMFSREEMDKHWSNIIGLVTL